MREGFAEGENGDVGRERIGRPSCPFPLPPFLKNPGHVSILASQRSRFLFLPGYVYGAPGKEKGHFETPASITTWQLECVEEKNKTLRLVGGSRSL